jgi:hypothetical protein
MAGLLVALGASACGEDPSVDFGGDAPTKIQASPTVMFVNQGTQKFVKVRLVDDRNRSTATSFEISNVSPGITVVLDETYRPDFIGSDGLEFNPIQHEHRLIVTGVAPVGAQFTVSSSGISQVVTVNVIPSEIPITFGALTNGTVDVTSENFTFDYSTTFDFDGIVQTPLVVSADGHTATILAPAAIAGVNPTISGARASYMPTIALAAAEGTASVGAGNSSKFGGNTQGAAPTVTLNGPDFTLTDAGADAWGPAVQGGPAIWYKITVPSARHLDITVDWDGGNDLDYFLVDESLGIVLSEATSAHPEHGAVDVEAGTYYLVIVDWPPSAGPPASWSIHITD